MRLAAASLALLWATPSQALPSCPALSLNGTAAYARAGGTIYPNSSTLVSFTAEAWIYPTLAPANGTAFIINDDAYELTLRYQPGNANGGLGIGMQIYGQSGNVSLDEYRNVSLNQWNHVALVFNGATAQARIAINGVLGSPQTFGAGSFGVFSDLFTVGAFSGNNPSSSFFQGYIDEVRVSDTVRYTSNFTPESPSDDGSTRALYFFSESVSATTFADGSGNNYLLSAFGGAVTGNSPACNVVPSFTTQPRSTRVPKGANGSFTVVVNGAPTPTLQWQISTNGGTTWTNLNNAAPYSGVTTTTLGITSTPLTLNGAQFRCVATNTSATTNSAAVPLLVGPSGFDWDGDAKADIALYRSTGYWYMRNSASNYVVGAGPWVYQWGANGDTPVQGDLDGDGKLDAVIFRPSTGQWFIRYSSLGYDPNQFGYFEWGAGGDQPFASDFDGDGKADIGLYRPSNGYWYLRLSTSNYVVAAGNWIFQWGTTGDVPKLADFDGDGKTDLTVFRPTTGQWFIRFSAANYDPAQFGYLEWGAGGDVPLVSDFDGDGKADVAVYRPAAGSWFIRNSSQSYVIGAGTWNLQWGAPGDLPRTGDFDADGKTDLVVYRPTTGQWFVLYSGTVYNPAQFGYYEWGAGGDTPLPTP